MTVLLPWSTWPTITIFIRWAPAAGAATGGCAEAIEDDMLCDIPP
jgi:hypothetical protein